MTKLGYDADNIFPESQSLPFPLLHTNQENEIVFQIIMNVGQIHTVRM